MGVDCRISLPHKARVRDVADVIGILAGRPWHWDIGDGYKAVRVPDVSIHNIATDTLAECADIQIKGVTVDGEHGHSVMYHFEWQSDDARFSRGMLAPSTAFWIAVGIRLVDFFGGAIDYDDCDNEDVDMSSYPRHDISADDGVAWDRFQQRKADVKPLTKADLKAADKFAAYKMREGARV